MNNSDFSKLSEAPENISATAIMIRLIDGIQFRFYHATEELSVSDHKFKPADDCMSTNELVHHIQKLCYWVHNSFLEEPSDLNFQQTNFNDMRLSILNKLNDIKSSLTLLSEKDLNKITIRNYPFWNMINGPLADILTHVGQMNTYRRLNKNPRNNPPSPFTGK